MANRDRPASSAARKRQGFAAKRKRDDAKRNTGPTVRPELLEALFGKKRLGAAELAALLADSDASELRALSKCCAGLAAFETNKRQPNHRRRRGYVESADTFRALAKDEPQAEGQLPSTVRFLVELEKQPDDLERSDVPPEV